MTGGDFSNEVRKHKSLVVRWIFAILGAVFLALGVAGIFLPVLPTTPFLLLSAACFARASSRIYHWLLHHRYLGPIILEWRLHRSMPYRAKRMALLLIVLSFSTSILFFVTYWQAQLAMGLAGLVLFAWVYRIPSRDGPGTPKDRTGGV
ncbi:MAG: YbaN family protein [Thiobacillus sp.]|nr:YbaN family protein [Thiobacillus sp.]